MSTENSVLLILLVLMQEGAAIRPAVTFSPNYKRIFATESITMTCDGGSTIGGGPIYIWYKYNSIVHNGTSYTIQSARISNSGSYRCQTSTGEISDPVGLDVFYGFIGDELILQTPLYVYEGDDINIRCHHRPGYRGGQTIFYKDNGVIRGWTDNAEYHIGNVNETTDGTYRCEKDINGQKFYYNTAYIFVKELLTNPTITVTPQPVFQKDNITLKCETRLPPARQNRQLRFAFYREGRIVQDFSINDIYEVHNVQLEHSEKYSCEVETTDGRVRKRSEERLLQIEGAAIRPAVTFSPDYKKIFTAESITMTCDGGSTVGGGPNYIWYKGCSPIYNGTTYTIESAETSDSGSYQCQTSTGEISDPAGLDVSDGQALLQTPLYVYEEDEINITCHLRLYHTVYSEIQTRFYKDDRLIRDWTDNAEYYIGNVNGTTAGTYRCEKDIVGEIHGDEATVSAEELFTTPTITVTPQPVFQKDNMTLTCETRLPPARQNTQLQFAFYKEGWIVQNFSINDIYEVYNVQLEHSGKYSCEVETTDGQVRKNSGERLLRIEGSEFLLL